MLAMAASVPGLAAPLRIELPPEKPAFKPSPGVEMAMANCLMCHSTEYISTQPALAPAAWKAIVEKMQKKFGAPIQAEQVDPVVDYLVKNYGSTSKPETAAAGGK